jgi:hypothetical protein
MTLTLAIIGVVLGVLNLLWNMWTWRGSGSRIQVETSFLIFPGLMRNQMMDLLARVQQPPELVNMAQHMIQYQSQFVLPPDLSYPASNALIAVSPPESIMVVATITNTGRLPVTIQRCQWQASQPGMIIETPHMPPGISFPHRLGENDRCISVTSLATIMSILDAPLRDKSVTGREARPVVEVADRRKPVRGNSLTIPARSQLPSEQPVAP